MIPFALFAAALPAPPAPAPKPIAEEALPKSAQRSALDGSWTGGMTVPAGLTIPFNLSINGDTGFFTAPDQKVSELPIRLARNGNSVTITLPSAGAKFVGSVSADGQRLDGTWSQGDRAFPAHFLRGSRTVATRSQTPKAPFPYRTQDVRVPGGSTGILLGTTLVAPDLAGPSPAILLLGGNGPQDRNETYSGHRPMLLIADRLARAGIASLRYDKRGVGSSTGHYSAERPDSELVADARSALDWLRRQPGIDAKRICVLGLSEGATVAGHVAALDPVRCVMLLSPPGLKAPELMAEQRRLAGLAGGASSVEARHEAELMRAMIAARAAGKGRDELVRLAAAAGRSPEAAEALASQALAPEMATFLHGDPVGPLRKIRAPVLVVAGTLDRQVPPDRNLPPIRRALAQNRNARFAILPGLNHLLQPAHSGSVAEYAEIDTTISEAALDAVLHFARRSLRAHVPNAP